MANDGTAVILRRKMTELPSFFSDCRRLPASRGDNRQSSAAIGVIARKVAASETDHQPSVSLSLCVSVLNFFCRKERKGFRVWISRERNRLLRAKREATTICFRSQHLRTLRQNPRATVSVQQRTMWTVFSPKTRSDDEIFPSHGFVTSGSATTSQPSDRPSPSMYFKICSCAFSGDFS